MTLSGSWDISVRGKRLASLELDFEDTDQERFDVLARRGRLSLALVASCYYDQHLTAPTRDTRNAYGLVLYKTDIPYQYYRVGVFGAIFTPELPGSSSSLSSCDDWELQTIGVI